MANGMMGKKLHPKIVERIRELLRKGELSAVQIAERVGASQSQVRNIQKGRDSQSYKKPTATVPDREYEALFGEKRPASTEPAPAKLKPAPKPRKPNPNKDLFADAPVSKYKPMTPELERRIIIDFRGNMPLSMVARKHGVSLAEVELLSERVYWYQLVDDVALRPCVLTKSEYLKTIGPKYTAAEMEAFQPTIDRFEEMLMEMHNVDRATATTIRKVMSLHHIEVGPPKTKPAPKCDQAKLSSSIVEVKPPKSLEPVATNAEVESVVATLFSEIEATVSDELEPLDGLCLRYFGREPDDFTVDAWTNGKNAQKRKLETFELDGQLMTTEKHFREYFKCFSA